VTQANTAFIWLEWTSCLECRSWWSSVDVCRNFSSHDEDPEAAGLQEMAVLSAAVILKMQKLLIFKLWQS